MGLTFDLRRNKLARRKLEQELKEALAKGDEFTAEEKQIDLDENLYGRANMEQTAHDRVRELNTWSKIKHELNDGSFDSKNVNTHQAESYRLALTNVDSGKVPKDKLEFIIILLSKFTCTKLAKDKLELGR